MRSLRHCNINKGSTQSGISEHTSTMLLDFFITHLRVDNDVLGAHIDTDGIGEVGLLGSEIGVDSDEGLTFLDGVEDFLGVLEAELGTAVTGGVFTKESDIVVDGEDATDDGHLAEEFRLLGDADDGAGRAVLGEELGGATGVGEDDDGLGADFEGGGDS